MWCVWLQRERKCVKNVMCEIMVHCDLGIFLNNCYSSLILNMYDSLLIRTHLQYGLQDICQHFNLKPADYFFTDICLFWVFLFFGKVHWAPSLFNLMWSFVHYSNLPFISLLLWHKICMKWNALVIYIVYFYINLRLHNIRQMHVS